MPTSRFPTSTRPRRSPPRAEVGTRDFLKFLNDRHLAQHPGDSELLARIASYELAARMQLSAAEVGDFSKESRPRSSSTASTTRNTIKAGFAQNCLLARRLVERGVRFVQLFNGAYAMGEGVGNWDGHKTLKEQYSVHAPILDQPCAALLKDMKARGLLERHARRLGDRVRPHAHVPERRQRPRSQSRMASPSG